MTQLSARSPLISGPAEFDAIYDILACWEKPAGCCDGREGLVAHDGTSRSDAPGPLSIAVPIYNKIHSSHIQPQRGSRLPAMRCLYSASRWGPLERSPGVPPSWRSH